MLATLTVAPASCTFPRVAKPTVPEMHASVVGSDTCETDLGGTSRPKTEQGKATSQTANNITAILSGVVIRASLQNPGSTTISENGHTPRIGFQQYFRKSTWNNNGAVMRSILPGTFQG
jgi:hypothetical protein